MIMRMSERTLDRNLSDQGRAVYAESFAVIAGSIGAPLVGLASLAAAVFLGMNGEALPAMGAAIPAVGITISQVVITIRRSKEHPPES